MCIHRAAMTQQIMRINSRTSFNRFFIFVSGSNNRTAKPNKCKFFSIHRSARVSRHKLQNDTCKCLEINPPGEELFSQLIRKSSEWLELRSHTKPQYTSSRVLPVIPLIALCVSLLSSSFHFNWYVDAKGGWRAPSEITSRLTSLMRFDSLASLQHSRH